MKKLCSEGEKEITKFHKKKSEDRVVFIAKEELALKGFNPFKIHMTIHESFWSFKHSWLFLKVETFQNSNLQWWEIQNKMGNDLNKMCHADLSRVGTFQLIN